MLTVTLNYSDNKEHNDDHCMLLYIFLETKNNNSGEEKTVWQNSPRETHQKWLQTKPIILIIIYCLPDGVNTKYYVDLLWTYGPFNRIAFEILRFLQIMDMPFLHAIM